MTWLRDHPPAGLVFNVFEWGDYLLWAGPPDVKVFVTSQAHLVPRDIWRDYLSVINQSSGWNEVFDRYGVQTLLLDKADRGSLIYNLREEQAVEAQLRGRAGGDLHPSGAETAAEQCTLGREQEEWGESTRTYRTHRTY